MRKFQNSSVIKHNSVAGSTRTNLLFASRNQSTRVERLANNWRNKVQANNILRINRFYLKVFDGELFQPFKVRPKYLPGKTLYIY